MTVVCHDGGSRCNQSAVLDADEPQLQNVARRDRALLNPAGSQPGRILQLRFVRVENC
jgi:hypothetical protein